MTDDERKLFMNLLDKFMKLSVENQSTLFVLTQGLKELEKSVGKSDSTVFSLLHRLMAEKKDIEKVHEELLKFLDIYSKRDYTAAEIEEIGGPLQEVYKLSENCNKQRELECTERILETNEFVRSIKKRWKWIIAIIGASAFIITFAERIVKLIIYLHGLGG